jgi:type I restriction enzyme S subunit
MNPELLLDHFNRISEAPDAIQRLRGLILDLAVRGKLVEQDANDEPASHLVKELTRRMSGQAGAGAATDQSTRRIVGDDVPYKIPRNWIWVRLRDLCSKTGSGSTPRGGKSVYQRSGIPFLRSQNVHDDGLRLDDVAYIAPQTHQKMSGTAVEPGDLLLNITGGSIGRCCLVQEGLGPANVSQHVAIIRVAIGGIQCYLHQLVLSPYFQALILSGQTGAGRGGLPKSNMDRIPVALPPLAEQSRIVSNVNELMTLCDHLQAAQAERENRRHRLAKTLLHRLDKPLNEEEFHRSVEFYLGELPRLTSSCDQIKQLRQTVLNLAVQGKLTPQTPTDGLVAEQLSANDRVRETTAKNDRRANAKMLMLLASESRWNVPTSWEWRALADLVLFIDYRGKTPAKINSGVRLLTAKNVKRGYLNLSPEEFLSERDYRAWMTRGFPKQGDILFTTEAPMGNATVVRLSERFALAQRLICFHPYGALSPEFLVLQFLSDPFRSILDETATGLTAKGIKAAKLKCLPVAVPPLAEQQRIVAKVNDLMALCDRLDELIEATNTGSSRLLEAVIAGARDAA